MNNCVYLIPTVLDDSATKTIPPYVLEAIKDCSIFFVENERTARRFFKSLDKEIIIDDYEWYPIHKQEEEQIAVFKNKIKEGKNIGIISEAGCPGVADPGQLLIETAQKLNVRIKPLVGPNSILLALMASGMNGQQFKFNGYLPIDSHQQITTLKELETESKKKNLTQIFIETPYRNNQLLEAVLKTCQPSTRVCVAAEITSATEYIKTKTVGEWKTQKPDLHKKPVIFLLQS
jgi:16S rRNA (cytidine1402-2'-O)-methyltransferase